jgi:hypothetical protein
MLFKDYAAFSVSVPEAGLEPAQPMAKGFKSGALSL